MTSLTQSLGIQPIEELCRKPALSDPSKRARFSAVEPKYIQLVKEEEELASHIEKSGAICSCILGIALALFFNNRALIRKRLRLLTSSQVLKAVIKLQISVLDADRPYPIITHINNT
jgi:hypothetical protein